MEREVLRGADDEIRRILDHLEMAAYLARPRGFVRSGGIRMEVEEAREKLKRLRETIRAALRGSADGYGIPTNSDLASADGVREASQPRRYHLATGIAGHSPQPLGGGEAL